MDAYFTHLLIIICIHVGLALSLQLSIGYSGLLNLGVVAFGGIGAYATALLTLSGWPFLLALLVGGLLAAIMGFLLSIPTGRLKGDYLAITTLGFTFVVYGVLLNWTSLTRGPMGIPGIPRPEIFGFAFTDNFSFLILALVVAALSYFLLNRIVNSLFGKSLEAVRDDELASKSLGKNVFKLKAISLATTAFFAGISGGMYASYITFIDPSSFNLMALIPMVLIVMMGGLASMPGTVLATIVIILLPEPLRFIGFPSSILGPMRQMIYAIALIVILYFKPRGFYGRIDLE